MVFDLTGSPFLTGLMVAFEAMAYVLVGLLAGTVADRADRTRLLIGGEMGPGRRWRGGAVRRRGGRSGTEWR
ncbi:hypothetical protein ACQPZJ_44140 [Actinoplanes sp. CA-054009]